MSSPLVKFVKSRSLNHRTLSTNLHTTGSIKVLFTWVRSRRLRPSLAEGIVVSLVRISLRFLLLPENHRNRRWTGSLRSIMWRQNVPYEIQSVPHIYYVEEFHFLKNRKIKCTFINLIYQLKFPTFKYLISNLFDIFISFLS